MVSLIIYILPIVLGIVAVVALIAGGMRFQVSRKATYFRIRRDAIVAAWRWLLVLILAITGVFVSLRFRRNTPRPELFNPSRSLTPTNAPASLTPYFIDPSLTPKDPFSGPPTLTPTRRPPTETAPPPTATDGPTITASAAPPITIISIASGISTGLEPVNTGDTFPAGLIRVYIFFEHTQIRDGTDWSQVLIYENQIVRSRTESWELGAAPGRTYHYFEANEGWPAGQYEVRFFVDDERVDSATYELTD